MEPHEACFYCDIGMSHFDELVFSELSPCKKPLVWMRYRDDIYDPWPHGEPELLKFTDWLNSLHTNIKFTVSYEIGAGVEFLDTYISDRDGSLHTDLYSKPSDTHAYLPPTSCHPYHICKNNPKIVKNGHFRLFSTFWAIGPEAIPLKLQKWLRGAEFSSLRGHSGGQNLIFRFLGGIQGGKIIKIHVSQSL